MKRRDELHVHLKTPINLLRSSLHISTIMEAKNNGTSSNCPFSLHYMKPIISPWNFPYAMHDCSPIDILHSRVVCIIGYYLFIRKFHPSHTRLTISRSAFIFNRIDSTFCRQESIGLSRLGRYGNSRVIIDDGTLREAT